MIGDPDVPPKLKPIATSNPLFNAVLLFVAAVCVLCIVGPALLALYAPEPMTKAQENFSSICMHGFMTSLALFVGLAGGRAAQPDFYGQLPTAPETSPPKAKTSKP